MAAAIFFALGVFDAVNSVSIVIKAEEEIKQWQRIAYATIFTCQLLIVAVSLSISYVYLAWNINKHFAKELKDEGRKIKAIFISFSLSYISRAVVYLLQNLSAIKHLGAVYYTMYFFWDVLPLCLIMRYHLQAFRAERKEKERSTTDWTRESNASSSQSSVSDDQSRAPRSETTSTDRRSELINED